MSSGYRKSEDVFEQTMRDLYHSSKDLDFYLSDFNKSTLGLKPKSILYSKVSKLIGVSKSKLPLIHKTFIDNPEVYLNISDEIVQVCMACLIKLINSKDGNYLHFYEDFLKLRDFKMSKDTEFKYSQNLKIIEDNISIYNKNMTSQINHNIYEQESQDGCYIATMVYGDYDNPQVLILRDFRDHFLNHYKLGKIFIKFYYKYSPKWVDIMKNWSVINVIIKKVLNTFIWLIK